MSQVLLDQPQVDTGFEQVRRIAVTQGVRTDTAIPPTELIHCALDHFLWCGFTHRPIGGRRLLAIASFIRKDPSRIAMCGPVLAHEHERLGRERHQSILVPLTAPDMDQHAFGIDVRDLQV